MKVTNEKTENSQAFLTVEMEPAEVEEALEDAYHHLVKKTNIPGFRKGKAPRAILERHVGRGSLLEDALSHLIPEVLEKVITEQKIQAVAQPLIEITQTEPVVFKMTVPLAPKVKLGDYQQIRVEETPVVVIEEDVDRVVEELRHQRAVWEPVERPVKMDDLVTLDIESSIGDEPFIKQAGIQYYAKQDSLVPVPGFVAQIMGMTIGEAKEFPLPLPADYPKKELAGQEALFKVKVAEVKQEKLPELTDDFAKQVGAEYQSLALLRERILANLKHRAEQTARRDLEEKAVDALVKSSELEFPPVLVEREVTRLINQRLQYWQLDSRGLDEYLKSINKTEAELREELRPVATKRVSEALAMDELAGAEKIEVSESEIDVEIEMLVKATAEKEQDKLKKTLNTLTSRESLKQTLVRRKVLERLAAIAKGATVSEETKKEVSA